MDGKVIMKRYNNIYNRIVDINAIIDMYESTIYKNIKNKNKIEKFDKLYPSNIIKIKDTLSSNNYTPGKYNIFLIKEPKIRIIMSQEIEDKIINHLVAKYLLIDIFEKTLSNDNCATRIGKGTHYALSLFKSNYNKYKNKYSNFYILKFDISKYFYNIDNGVVKDIIRRKIKDKKSLKIIFSIIDSTDADYVNREINKIKNNEINRINGLNISEREKYIKIKEIKDIPIYRKGKGCPIGNMSSQIIATFYLNDLDWYIKNELNIKCYTRYMDDGVIIHHDRKYLEYCKSMIREKLIEYKLELNSKTNIYSSEEKIEFLEFKFFINERNKIVMQVSNKTKKKFINKMSMINSQYNNNIISFDEYRSVRDSYLGHLGYGCCRGLCYKYIK